MNILLPNKPADKEYRLFHQYLGRENNPPPPPPPRRS